MDLTFLSGTPSNGFIVYDQRNRKILEFDDKANFTKAFIGIGIAILAHPVLEGGQFNAVLRTKRFSGQTRFLPPGNQIKIVGLFLGHQHRFLP